ncbi:MAG: hypothetical protein ACRDKZ_00700 [Actinomycetota bacterium]
MTWETLLIACLALNAVLGFAYRLHRLSRGGPLYDVVGQTVLALLLGGLALSLSWGAGWPRWVALGYGLLFGLVVMPLWVLAVLLPMRPGRIDYGFTAVYWAALGLIVASALVL